MKTHSRSLFLGKTSQKQPSGIVEGEFITLFSKPFYKIRNFDTIEPFFISLVSSSDHWLFVASTGGISAGRGSVDHAIFPYYTVDKITENNENTGHKAIFLVDRFHKTYLWEPFSDHYNGIYSTERNLYKDVSGMVLVFEEINFDLELVYRYAWRTSDKFGFVKTSWLENRGSSPVRVELIDGVQNIVPANVTSQTQNTLSSLLDAYKFAELHDETGLALFILNSRLTDLAEPSESLSATTAFQVGCECSSILLSSIQLDSFRNGRGVTPETQVRGRRGAYFIHTFYDLEVGQEASWHILTDTDQDADVIATIIQWLRGDRKNLSQEIEADISAGQKRLWEIVATGDGVQVSNNPLLSAHHFANVMFNIMRGGVFVDQYWVRTQDFIDYVAIRNRRALQENALFFSSLPPMINCSDLTERAEATNSPDLFRLSHAYLPLTFSRRHGDPSRPWNRFAINIKYPDGSQKLDYEGNWRDIFQNWEALAFSFPEFTESMISTFLNSTTVDGYNPYRITYHGVDWEKIEQGNPWANIGYWSDHQIIYLQKLMEISASVHPGRLQAYLARPVFSSANVPYRIKPYKDVLSDPYHTIDFDNDLEQLTEIRMLDLGTDGKLVFTPDGNIFRSSLSEKLLVLLLAKLANFVPEGGIWMNTQRPEWNDANNALVGKGLSVVTLCYLRRYVAFCKQLFTQSNLDSVPLSVEVQQHFAHTSAILTRYLPILKGSFSDEQRYSLMENLGLAGSEFRWNFYRGGVSGASIAVDVSEILSFLDLALAFIEHSLRANKRRDDLYHSYNILHVKPGNASIGRLYEMLEGQVAVLSSGLLNADESLALLNSLRNSALFQADQQSYLLYPDREVAGLLNKNNLKWEQVRDIALFQALIEAKDTSLITVDIYGVYHFCADFCNIRDVRQALDNLKHKPQFASLVEADFDRVCKLYEETFRHSEFTGRSGTFFAYEGLGSVYWHMVAKLLLAVQEIVVQFKNDENASKLIEKYQDIRQGLGFNKSPQAYGAFPTDPYSHTPKGQGAKQPGMTGLVKEEILTRKTELGYTVTEGKLVFDLVLLDTAELLTAPTLFQYLDTYGREQHLQLPAGSIAYTICQVPIILHKSVESHITVHLADGNALEFKGHSLDLSTSQHIFLRDGLVSYIEVAFPAR